MLLHLQIKYKRDSPAFELHSKYFKVCLEKFNVRKFNVTSHLSSLERSLETETHFQSASGQEQKLCNTFVLLLEL